MPKHTIEIPCSAGDKIRVVRGYFGRVSQRAVVSSVTYHDGRVDARITVRATTPDGQVQSYIWGKSAFELEGEDATD